MAQIYGELIRAQLQVSASDLTSPVVGLVYFNSTTGLKWHTGSAWKVAVDLDSSQTLAGKTLNSSCVVDSAALPIVSLAKGGLGADASGWSGVLKISGGVSEASAILNADIDAAAAIDATKIADGSVDNTAFQKLFTVGTDAAGELVNTDGTQTLTNKTLGTGCSFDPSALPVTPPSKGGTGIANTENATLTRTGDHPVELITSSNTSLILPTSGILATLDGSETLINKSVSSTAALTGALKLPVGNNVDSPTGQRPSINDFTASQLKGMIRYNDTDDVFEGYNELSGWSPIGGGGTTDRVFKSSHGFVVGDVLYMNGSVYEKAIATSAAAAEVVGVVSKIIDTNNFEITLSGEVTGITSPVSLTVGEVYFLSAATAGLLTVDEPTVVGQVSVPVGVASSTTSLYVAPKRGSVVGSSNARTQIALSGGLSGGPFTTTVQNIAAYDAGELTGWVSITATTPLRFYVAAQFSKNGAANNYNLSYQVSGDTPPALFSMTVTAGGLLQVTLPSLTGFASASINFALNAPAIGTSFPLTVDSSSVQFQKIVPKDTSGISVRNAADSATNVFVSNTGNVGIGTTSPQENLHIRSSAPRIRFEDTDGGGSYAQISANYSVGGISIQADATNAAGNSVISFDIDGNQVAYFDANGRILVGASAASGTAVTRFYSKTGSGTTWQFASGTSNSGNTFFVLNGSDVGVSLTSGSTSWGTSSDERVKKNILPLELGLNHVKQLKPVRFDYKADESDQSERVGFIAQEVLPVLPHAVTVPEDSEQMMSLSTTEMIPVLVKAIQQLKEELDAAKSEIAALKGV
jgi:hypothetical protein